LAAARAADYITFTSSSTVRYFLQAAAASAGDGGTPKRTSAETPPGEDATAHRSDGPAHRLPDNVRIVSIGPATSETLREHGLEPHVEAERHDIVGMIDALLADAASGADDDHR
jgi:uroporphyrinogen III methyltransferase / synthase